MTRQVVQWMWQAWHHGDTETISGLLAGRDSHICEMHLLKGVNDMKEVVQHWQSQGLQVMGSFFSHAVQLDEVENYRKHLQNWGADRAFEVHMALNVDTQGCLKSQAYVQKADALEAVPVLLTEDGQSTPIS